MRTGGSPVAIDANVILRHLLGDNPELSPKARDTMNAVQRGQLTVVCDPVTLAEVVWVLQRFYKMDQREMANELDPLLGANHFMMADKALYRQALALYGASVSHFGDACACATALQECNGKLLSFDQELSRVNGVERIETPPQE